MANTLSYLLIAGMLWSGCVLYRVVQAQSHNSKQHEKHRSSKFNQKKHKRKKQEKKHSEARIHLTGEQVTQFGIQVEAPEMGSAASLISRPATVTFDPNRIARVGPVVEGRVRNVTVIPGDTVKKGDVLVRLESAKLGRAKAAYLSEVASLKTRKAAYERKSTLYEKDIASQSELQMARSKYKEARAEKNEAKELLKMYGVSKKAIQNLSFSSESSMATTLIRSPISGTVQKRSISQGDVMKTGDQPIHVVNTNRMWLMIDAYEKDLTHVQKGDSVTFSPDALSDKRFKGTVDWISKSLDGETRTVKIRSVLDNKNHVLRDGMFGEATIHTSPKNPLPMVPVDAVQDLHGKKVVFVPAQKENAYAPKPVTLGEESENGWVEVKKGLTPEQKVVISGAFDLKAAFTAQSRSAAHSH